MGRSYWERHASRERCDVQRAEETKMRNKKLNKQRNQKTNKHIEEEEEEEARVSTHHCGFCFLALCFGLATVVDSSQQKNSEVFFNSIVFVSNPSQR